MAIRRRITLPTTTRLVEIDGLEQAIRGLYERAGEEAPDFRAGNITKYWAARLQMIGDSQQTLVFGNHADRADAPAGNFLGALFYEEDRRVWYLSRYARGTVTTNGVDVVLRSGDLFQANWANKTIVIDGSPYLVDTVDPATGALTLTVSAGMLTNVQFTIDLAAWYFAFGRMPTLLAGLPVDLGALDAGFRAFLPEYVHELAWDGFAWKAEDIGGGLRMTLRAPYTHIGTCDVDGSTVTWLTGPKFDPQWGAVNRIRVDGTWCGVTAYTNLENLELDSSPGPLSGVDFEFAIGWHFCDGKGDNNVGGGTVSVLNSDGTASSVSVPDLTVGAFPKLGPAAGSAVDPAIPPVITGHSADESAHTHDVNVPAFLTDDNNLVIEVQAGTGAFPQQAIHHHQADPPNTTSSAGTAHHHDVGTLEIALADVGEPQSFSLMPWLRK